MTPAVTTTRPRLNRTIVAIRCPRGRFSLTSVGIGRTASSRSVATFGKASENMSRPSLIQTGAGSLRFQYVDMGLEDGKGFFFFSVVGCQRSELTATSEAFECRAGRTGWTLSLTCIEATEQTGTRRR